MSLSSTEFAADMTEIIADLPATMIWNSTSYSVAAGDLSKSASLEMAGVALESGILIVAKKADFPSSVYPPVNERITIGGVDVRVISVSVGADNVSVSLVCDRRSA